MPFRNTTTQPILSTESLSNVQDLLRNVSQDMFVEVFKRIGTVEIASQQMPKVDVDMANPNACEVEIRYLPSQMNYVTQFITASHISTLGMERPQFLRETIRCRVYAIWRRKVPANRVDSFRVI